MDKSSKCKGELCKDVKLDIVRKEECNELIYDIIITKRRLRTRHIRYRKRAVKQKHSNDVTWLS